MECTTECPVCFEVKVILIQCKTCYWQCCDDCSEKWAKETNTCMQCRTEIFERREENIDRRQHPRHTCYKSLRNIIDSFTFLSIFMLFLNFVLTANIDDDGDMLDDENDYKLVMVTVLGLGIILLFRFVARQILYAICVEGYDEAYEEIIDSD